MLDSTVEANLNSVHLYCWFHCSVFDFVAWLSTHKVPNLGNCLEYGWEDNTSGPWTGFPAILAQFLHAFEYFQEEQESWGQKTLQQFTWSETCSLTWNENC